MNLRALLLCWCIPFAAYAADVGQTPPALTGMDLQSGQAVDLDAMHGRVVLVDFWASWCAPCLKSLPLYARLREEFPRADFEIIAISVDEDAADARAFLKRVEVRFPIVHDDGSRASAWSPPGMPSSFLIDRQGLIQSRHIGFKPGDIDALRDEVRTLIEASHAP